MIRKKKWKNRALAVLVIVAGGFVVHCIAMVGVYMEPNRVAPRETPNIGEILKEIL